MNKHVNNARDEITHAFFEDMKRLHLQAGRPTLKEIEATSKQLDGRVLSRSTIHDILNGKRTRLPNWQVVSSFVAVCRIHAEQNEARLDQFATEEEWHHRWYVAGRSCTDTAQWPVTYDTTGDSEPAVRRRHSSDDLMKAQRATMLALAGHCSEMSWWHDYHDVVPCFFETYLSLEPTAELIRAYEPSVVPDLLQTEEYAHTVIRLSHPRAGDAEIDRRVELRMHRQRILRGPDPTTLWVIIDEDALRHPYIPSGVMNAQITHLAHIGRQANIALQVMPAGNATGGGPVTVLRFPERELPDVVYLEQHTHGLYPHKPEDIHHYIQVLDRLGIEANKPADAKSVLDRILLNS